MKALRTEAWQAWRSYQLFSCALRVWLRYAGPKLADRLRGRDPALRDLAPVHRRCAEDVFRTSLRMQGVMVKLCQVVGTRPDMFPPEYVRVLSQAHDRVPARPFEQIRPLVEAELGKPLGAVFSEFDPVPVAAASLAQVHRARLLDGEEVAVKVQYSDIEQAMRADLSATRRLVRVYERFERRPFDFSGVLEEMEWGITQELDFLREIESAERVREIFAKEPLIRVPRIHRELCRRRVIVMEFMRGTKITDRTALEAAGIDLEDLMVDLSRAYNRMILGSGFFHADPHPGNLLINPVPDGGHEITLLDFGLAKQLPKGFGLALFELMFSLMTCNEVAMVRAFETLGFSTRTGDSSVYLELARRMMRAAGTEEGYAGELTKEMAEEFTDALRDNPFVRVPSDFVLVARTFALLSGIAHMQGMEDNVLDSMAPIT